MEVVVLLGTITIDESAAILVVESGILEALVNLLNGKLKFHLIVYIFLASSLSTLESAITLTLSQRLPMFG